MNLYQNKIWRAVSQDVFHKEIFEIYLFNKKYWGVKKTHKKYGIPINWFQVLGVEIPEKISENKFKQELQKIKKDFSALNNIFFQFGFINQLDEPFFENRKKIEKEYKKYGLFPSIKENMPLSTVIVDISEDEESIYKKFSKSARRNIRKAEKENLYFTVTNTADIDNFYNLWFSTAKLKGFHIYSYKQYKKLIEFLKNTGAGNLYLVKKENTIVSGSIEINEGHNSYYLYGATNRNFIKLGGHYFLKREMFKYLKKKGVKYVDLLGVSPQGFENHHLKGVSQFKHSLGGKHIEYFGNFDLPLNTFLYKIIKKIRRKDGYLK